MLAPENASVAIAMLFLTMTCWGSWSSIRMKCNADGPVFALFYITGQFITGCLLSSTLGMITGVNGYFDNRTFYGGFSHPGEWYKVLAIMVGGSACANSDFLASCAMSRLPFSVVVPIFMGWSLVQATIISFFIEGADTNPYFLFTGLTIALLAIFSMAMSDAHGNKVNGKDSDNTQELYRSISRGSRDVATELNTTLLSRNKDEIDKALRAVTAQHDEGIESSSKPLSGWIYVSLFAGIVAGLWSPLQVFGREGAYAVDNPCILLFFFQLGEVISIPFILFYHNNIIIPVDTKAAAVSTWSSVDQALNLPLADKMYGFLAGGIVSCGTYIFFAASGEIASTIAFAISSCAPLVTIFLGVCVFGQLRNAPRAQTFFIALATVLFVLAIALLVLAGMF